MSEKCEKYTTVTPAMYTQIKTTVGFFDEHATPHVKDVANFTNFREKSFLTPLLLC